MDNITMVSTPAHTQRKNRTAGFAPGTLALAISGALMASAATADETSIALDKLKIEESLTPDTNPYAVPGAPYLADRVSDPRRTRSLAETPQTITVLTAAEISDSGRSDLREILDGQPGITLGTGENGNAFGDRYIIRGHEARSDIFIDGLRDPGMTVRESFAVEQVEISKGPSSSFAGRGTTGGAVNSATKRASTEYDFTKLSAGIGTDNYHRLTLDTNQVIDYDTALRANILDAQEDVPERSPADRERIGAALSLSHQFTDQLEMTADYYHFEGNDSPDLGTYIDRSSGKVVRNIPAYVQDEDFLESQVDTFTVRMGYEINPQTRIVNLTRYGTTDNGYITTGARGTTAYSTLTDATNDANGYTSASLSTHQGWQEVEYFANQLNLLTTQEIGGLDHELVIGAEYSNQSVLNGVYNTSSSGSANCFTVGRSGVGESYCITDADGNTVAGVNHLMQRDITRGDADSDWNVETLSLSLMDTVDLTDRWTLFGGIRHDYYDYKTTANFDPDGRSGPLPSAPHDFTDKGGYWNGHMGASYDITPRANIYASFSTATNLNGGESDVGTSCGYGGICVDASDPQLGDPERTQSWELGTKWRLQDDRLLATAALFQITKNDVMEQPTGDSYSTEGSLNTGKNRVEGIELGLAGNLTERLSVQAGLAVMNAEVLESVNADNVGKTLANFADKSASLLLKYQATPAFALGGSATYESARYTGQPDTAANEDLGVPEYTVFDAFASYQVNRDLKFRLNVGNLFNKDYYLAAYRSGSFTYIGDKRNAQLTMEYSF
ncbi:catecholate siderophore receptor [Amphritea atlantica]|uniref:Catecholate siderophore receptor n=1 Tax=Amphritea atlantica TaxID=355243 RepID=A0A1H9HAR1_9GAMM|nr:TonB-dependent receptor [Amphritea atlantica]SEQ59338.1 catecholate siderophore receptor [Amphritea atlantica]